MSEVIEHNDGALSFPGLDYSDESLNELWEWIRDDLATEGRVYNEKIVEKHEENPAGYSEATLRGALSKLRSALNRARIIDVKYESPGEDEDGKGGGTRNLWVIDQ